MIRYMEASPQYSLQLAFLICLHNGLCVQPFERDIVSTLVWCVYQIICFVKNIMLSCVLQYLRRTIFLITSPPKLIIYNP